MDWWVEAIKNLSLDTIFSLPFILILVDKKIFKQNPDQYPITLPPKRTILFGKSKVGKNNKEIIIIPKKRVS